jgi:hypothetical protein
MRAETPNPNAEQYAILPFIYAMKEVPFILRAKTDV